MLFPETKKCNQCKQIKNKNEFYLNNTSKDGLATRCSICCKLYMRQHQWAHKLQSYYGITEIEYETILKSQNEVCAICNQPETKKHQNGKIIRLSVDHCHITGKIRGLLCVKCNSYLGHIADDLKILQKAIEYLKGNIS